MRWLLLLLGSLSLSSCVTVEDSTLRLACEQRKGNYTPRDLTTTYNKLRGDLCEMSFDTLTVSEQDAKEFCELFAPWRQIEAVHGKQTKCTVEATLICKQGWVQMFGYCLRQPVKRKRANLKDAEAICASENGQIATLRHKYIVGVWRRVFPELSQIWVQASEAWEPYVDMRIGDEKLALSFTGKHYEFFAKPNSLNRVSSQFKMHVLCEYKPPITTPEINYLGRRYSEIYFQSVPIKHGVVIRTTSHYTRSSDHLDVCKNVLKPFMVNQLESFKMMENDLQSIGENGQSAMFTRSEGVADLDIKKINSKFCERAPKQFKVRVNSTSIADHQLEFVRPEPVQQCDNMLSAAIVVKGKTGKVRAMSDSTPAPIWCKLGVEKKYTYKVPEGYEVFHRANDVMFAHRYVKEQRLNWEDAEDYCRLEQAHLSGFDSMRELEFLEQMLIKENAPNGEHVFLGAYKRDGCYSEFHVNPLNICGRPNIMEWYHSVARNPMTDEMWRDPSDGKLNPNFRYFLEYCLAMAHGDFSWADPNSKGYLDDIRCRNKNHFFCGKYIEYEVE